MSAGKDDAEAQTIGYSDISAMLPVDKGKQRTTPHIAWRLVGPGLLVCLADTD
eukprot:CAMPEP_0180532676 /NCGR_PEP_ID=MMETSP1036_2-20121128/63192_1 /TAXON_ID=632150 /ORGANISM="Azadinium spinosum, Strain 3D9" /LENGTH=52 /DNA_ID=CAMNT_0022546785 /DNA_START=59 /DNA_END=214 /DNA_ORIENTATION=+